MISKRFKIIENNAHEKQIKQFIIVKTLSTFELEVVIVIQETFSILNW